MFIELKRDCGQVMFVNVKAIGMIAVNTGDKFTTNLCFTDGEEMIVDIEYKKLKKIIQTTLEKKQ